MQAFCSLHELHVPCGSFTNLAHSGTLRYFSIAGRSARVEHQPEHRQTAKPRAVSSVRLRCSPLFVCVHLRGFSSKSKRDKAYSDDYRVFSRDIMTAIFVSQNNVTAATLVSLQNTSYESTDCMTTPPICLVSIPSRPKCLSSFSTSFPE